MKMLYIKMGCNSSYDADRFVYIPMPVDLSRHTPNINILPMYASECLWFIPTWDNWNSVE